MSQPSRSDDGVREQLLGPPRVRHLLAQLPGRTLNFDRSTVSRCPPPAGWRLDDIRHPLRAEEPGPPANDGTFALARRLIGGYEFADPSIVRAYYDPEHPLRGRNMVLRLRALGIVSVLAGVRVLDVIDEPKSVAGRHAQVWGWRYGTLEGHVEMGEMSWEVWKWLDTGEIDFRIHAISREAPIRNPLVRIGFRLIGPHERTEFLNSTRRRMDRFTQIASAEPRPHQALRDAAAQLTSRPTRDDGAHAQLARSVDREP